MKLIILFCLLIIIIGIGIFIWLRKGKKKIFKVANSVIMEEDKSDKLVSEALSLASTVKKEEKIEDTTGSFASSNLAQEINNNQNKINNK